MFCTEHMLNDSSSFSSYRAHKDHCHFGDTDISVSGVSMGTGTVLNDDDKNSLVS
jgi:hypothetical protein